MKYQGMVDLNGADLERIRSGALTLQPGQWVRIDGSSTPSRWVGLSGGVGGSLWAVHYPDTRTSNRPESKFRVLCEVMKKQPKQALSETLRSGRPESKY